MIGKVEGYASYSGISRNLTDPSGVLKNPGESTEKKAGHRSSPAECETCKNRKYQDGSDEMVSFKSAAHIFHRMPRPVVCARTSRSMWPMPIIRRKKEMARWSGHRCPFILPFARSVGEPMCPAVRRIRRLSIITRRILIRRTKNPRMQSRTVA